ncbi:MAG: acetyltransferase [Bacteroidales bacterium]
MKQEIYVIGTGGLSKEVYFLINEINNADSSSICDFKGFIDVDRKFETLRIGNKLFDVFEESDFINKNKNDKSIQIAIGIGYPQVIKKVAEKFLPYFSFPNLIHPNFVGNKDSIEMGTGNIITAGCVFTCDIKIGSFNYFNLICTLGHDSVVGSFNVINPGTNISGGVVIGDCNLIGTNATILQYIKIGNNSTLGAGSLLNKELEDNTVKVGVPARPMQSKN